jgi:hypothetical protein
VRSAVSSALLDVQQNRHLIDLWIRGTPDARENGKLNLSVHTVAFQRMVTVSEDGTVDSLNHVFKIDGDLLDQSGQNAQAFVASLKKYWNQCYYARCVFQLQPVTPSLHCGIIHATPTINGKGTSERESLLFSLKRQFETEFHLDVWEIAI